MGGSEAGVTTTGAATMFCSSRSGEALAARLAKPLPGTSDSWPAEAESTSRRLMSAGLAALLFCRTSAMTPATKGAAWEVPVRSLRGAAGQVVDQSGPRLLLSFFFVCVGGEGGGGVVVA